MEEIPEVYQNFCKAVGRLARDYELTSFDGSFQLPVKDMRTIRKIDFHWISGRHNAETGNISIHADMWVTTKVDEELIPELQQG